MNTRSDVFAPFILFALVLAIEQSGLSQTVRTEPEATTRLYIRTAPSGARVEINGKSAGVAPQLIVVPPGARRSSVNCR